MYKQCSSFLCCNTDATSSDEDWADASLARQYHGGAFDLAELWCDPALDITHTTTIIAKGTSSNIPTKLTASERRARYRNTIQKKREVVKTEEENEQHEEANKTVNEISACDKEGRASEQDDPTDSQNLEESVS